jgi:hypothetical protein
MQLLSNEPRVPTVGYTSGACILPMSCASWYVLIARDVGYVSGGACVLALLRSSWDGLVRAC